MQFFKTIKLFIYFRLGRLIFILNENLTFHLHVLPEFDRV